MENKYAIGGMILILIISLFAGAFLFSTHTVEEAKECPVVATPVCEPVTIIENVTVEAASDLDLAIKAFLKAVEDEEDEAGNDVEILDRYDFDEMSVKDIAEEYTISYTDEKTIVEFVTELKFKDRSSSVRNGYNVKVTFKEDDDTIVKATLI